MITLRSNRIIIKINPLAALPLGLISVDVGKTWAKDQLEATVVGVGPDCEDLKAGDTILITGEAGRWMDAGLWDPEDRDSTYRYMREDDEGILGVLEMQEAACA